MKLGEYLKFKRKKLNLTQEEVAKYLEVPKGTISKWECGLVTEISRTNIKLLSEVLNIDPARIVRWDENDDVDTSETNDILLVPKKNNLGFTYALYNNEETADLTQEQKDALHNMYNIFKNSNKK